MEGHSHVESTPAVTSICLVRHGETDWNSTGRYQGQIDIPLNEVGLQQAAVVAAVIANEPAWDAIVSSPLARARQTAEAIASAVGIEELIFDADLKERSYGEAEGLTIAERTARWTGNEWPGLEPYESLQQRGVAALDRVAQRFPGLRVLVVCHGGLMNAILAHHSTGEHGTGVTVIRNTARTHLAHDGSAWTIETVTDASHLDLAIR
jgi:uncharacterized phosphatase